MHTSALYDAISRHLNHQWQRTSDGSDWHDITAATNAEYRWFRMMCEVMSASLSPTKMPTVVVSG